MEITLKARGHENVTGRHRSTFEVTKDPEIGPTADCIIGVRADTACADLPEDFKLMLRRGARVEVILRAGGTEDRVVGVGHPRMTLQDGRSMVFRTSDYIDDRTVLIRCNKAARDLSRDLVRALKDPETVLMVEMRVLDVR
ncbi:DUF371 domain-containing protein [Methanopyrus kandleri]|uniref:Uncharacterized protein conserved in archaea n=2 Tax=Methanopyrus kandleri TaxID=2320 RepID=Q8TUU6_METKA|nr:DUF371 domain-containing protein [Methanopyrus kandleri]AAM02870.1 Uncharacterized protein conserved in archaea [Methanopyrus kandleri AV19]HII70899.1 DUF371 domain-containing protein [Methanopyrus kandleri]